MKIENLIGICANLLYKVCNFCATLFQEGMIFSRQNWACFVFCAQSQNYQHHFEKKKKERKRKINAQKQIVCKTQKWHYRPISSWDIDHYNILSISNQYLEFKMQFLLKVYDQREHKSYKYKKSNIKKISFALLKNKQTTNKNKLSDLVTLTTWPGAS